MTRINVVPVEELHKTHLVAEYRELPRIFKLAKGYAEKHGTDTPKGAPAEYALGSGHVKFFYTRLGYCVERMQQLIAEMIKRGYNPKFTDVSFDIVPEWDMNYKPTEGALAINRARINDRLTAYFERKKA
jgi:deoxyribonuclease (pyrimidine dimer)